MGQTGRKRAGMKHSRREILFLVCCAFTHNELPMYCGQIPCSIVDKILVCSADEQLRSRLSGQDCAGELLRWVDGPATA